MTPHFEIYPEQSDRTVTHTPDWRWRFIAGNGENTANGSEGYASESDARRAVNTHCDHIAEVCGVLGPISHPPVWVEGKDTW